MQNRRPISASTSARLTPVSLTIVTAIAMLLVVAMALLLPRPARADHGSMQVVCPDPIREGNTGQMRVTMPGRKDISLAIFTYHGDYTASSDDFAEYHGARVESMDDEDTVRVPVVTKEDTLVEHDETFSIGFWVHGEWNGCVVTIDDDDVPEITFVEISSRPADGFLYRTGESIDVTVNVDANVEVEGTSLLSLYVGDAGSATWRGASYSSGSGSRSLVFRYTVQPGDLDDDGVTVSSAGSNDDGTPSHGFSGSIFAEGTDVHIEYAHSEVQGDVRQRVDGRPYVQIARVTSSPSEGFSAYRANQTIELALSFDQDVVVEGDVTAGLTLGLQNNNWTEAARQAEYLHGSGTDRLVFGYTVVPGDMDSKGIRIALGELVGHPLSRFGGSGTIKASGTDVEGQPMFRGTGRLPEHKVDTEAPSVSSLSFTSLPADGQAYRAGEVISVEVVFTENVTADEDVQMVLDIGGVARTEVLDPVSARATNKLLVFHYTVQEGDADADGVGIAANSFTLNDGGIYDSAGNIAALAHAALTADPAHKVATAPAS